ncbi:MAG: NAD(P)-dependent oxidoreductase [Microscillaceae bacterium]|nr:NAD(P)-dependent oxidoreductase [Microscillaceae bacterium]
MKKILIGHPVPQALLNTLNQELEVHCIASVDQKYEQIIQVIDQYDALLAAAHKVDKAMMDKATHLQMISNHGVGYDNIDIEYARQKGIAVTNLPNSTSAPTATLAMSLILSLMRRVVYCDRKLRQSEIQNWIDPNLYGHAPENKTLGIIGMGRIGKALAKRALAFDMKICYHNRNPLSADEAAAYQASYVSLDQLLAEADVISIHTPLTPETQYLISTPEFAKMKPNAFLINTSRGGVIDQEALIQALQNKQIAGAGLDVFENEPEIPEALLALDNVVLSPHIGTATVEDRRAMMEEAFGNILKFFKGEPLHSRVV